MTLGSCGEVERGRREENPERRDNRERRREGEREEIR